MRRYQENQVRIALKQITKIRNTIYREFERQQNCQNDEFEKNSDNKIQDLLHKIKTEADAIYWAI